MTGRQVRLAGHRFRAVVDPRIRGMDCGDAAASDQPGPGKAEQDLWTRYVPAGGDVTRSKANGQSAAAGKAIENPGLMDTVMAVFPQRSCWARGECSPS